MNRNIPQNILDELPEFDLDKYEYEWGPCQFIPGIQHYCNGVWENGNGGFIKFIHRWPKLKTRYELIPWEERRVGDEWLDSNYFNCGYEEWHLIDDTWPPQKTVIRRKIEEDKE